MVNKDEILTKLMRWFHFTGKPHIQDDGVVNIDGDVTMVSPFPMSKLPVKFGVVDGTFKVRGVGLETLEGSPQSVLSFDCSGNNLTSLEGGPSKVQKGYVCGENKLLTSLKGAPTSVSFIFACNSTKLKSLEYLPQNHGSGEMELYVPWFNKLPLLRICLINNKHVTFAGGELNYARKSKLEEIFNSADAQGPAGVLKTASILTELSSDRYSIYTFEDNAEL